MRADPNLFVIGEDVGAYGGEMGVTQRAVGRVRRLADQGCADRRDRHRGLRIGAAITGVRACPEIPFGDFLGVCMDQVCNQAAKIRYMTGGQLTVPLTLRTTMGGYLNAAAQHSQSLEAWVAHIPGLKVVMPSTPADAAGLLRSSLRDGNPVVFFEHKAMYGLKGEVPEDPEHQVPLGVASVVRPGTDVTVVATDARCTSPSRPRPSSNRKGSASRSSTCARSSRSIPRRSSRRSQDAPCRRRHRVVELLWHRRRGRGPARRRGARIPRRTGQAGRRAPRADSVQPAARELRPSVVGEDRRRRQGGAGLVRWKW